MASPKILIIDDDMTALDIVDFLFEDRGYEVIRRADGKSAVDSVKEISPDIILVDLMMPNLSGQDTVRLIRSLGFSQPIVAFTAIDDPEIHDEAREAGCNLVLTKPCKPQKLVGHIEELLN